MLRLGKRNRGARHGILTGLSAVSRGIPVLVLIGAGLLMAGCSVNGMTNASLSSGGGTVAFDSIDGLPRGQFQKLVKALTDEAEARQIAVVTRKSPATYRARGYASAHLRGKETVIAWVWDVYDASQQRAVRIVGEVKGAGGQRGWLAADETTLKRIAGDSVAQLAAFLAHPDQPMPPLQTPPDAVVVADGTVETGPKTAVNQPRDAGWRPQTPTRSTITAYSETSPR